MADDTFEEIENFVRANGGVGSYRAWQLRDAQGAGRLTQRINENIRRSLAGRGLGTIPGDAENMPTSQGEWVRVYAKDTPLGRVLEAALLPGEDEDEVLREGVDGAAATMVERIREIVLVDE